MSIFSNIALRAVARLWKLSDAKTLKHECMPEGVVHIKDIPYGDNSVHKLDVFYPVDTAQTLPAVIQIHGGGLFYGDKSLNSFFSAHLALKGFTVFSVNYRLAPAAKLGGQLSDIASAINFILSNAGGYNADCTSLVLSGESAGALLAVLIALSAGSERIAGEFGISCPPINISAMFLSFGMYELNRRGITIGSVRSTALDKGYRNSGFYKIFDYDNLAELKGLPPCYIVSSADDLLNKMTFNFERALKKAEVLYKLNYIEKSKEKYGHISNVLRPSHEYSKKILTEATEFITSGRGASPR